jgi:hypothetical protein
LAGQVSLPAHDPAPLQVTSQAQELPQSMLLMQVSIAVQRTSQRPVGQSIAPAQAPVVVQSTAHSLAAEQSTPPAQAPAPLQSTVHGTSGGQVTSATQADGALQSIRQRPPSQLSHSAGHTNGASGPSPPSPGSGGPSNGSTSGSTHQPSTQARPSSQSVGSSQRKASLRGST